MRALTRGRRAFTSAALLVATAVLLGAAGLAAAGGSGPARGAGGAVVLDEGEFDLTPRVVDGKLELQIDDRGSGTTVVREPSDVVLHAVQSSLQSTLDPVAVALGTTNMDTWQLNGWEAENIFAPEPGWNGTQAGGATEVTLSGYEGPGDFGMAAYTREMDSMDAPAIPYLGSVASVQRTFTLPSDEQRLLPVWQFTKEGVYRLTFTVTGGSSTDTETLAVVVGDDVDPNDVLPGDGSTPTLSTPPTSSTPTGAPPSTSVTPTAPAAHVIDNGHLDLAARPVDGSLQFQIKEGTAQDYDWREPETVVLHVKPAARRKITEGYEFLGPVGDPVWWLPIQQVDGLVWPGWSTDQFKSSEIDGRVAFRLDAVQGPGAVSIFTEGSVGSVIMHAHSGDGLPDSFDLSVPTHRHTVWTFAQEGVYRTTFTVSATLADGRKVSDTETIAWVVGDDVDPSTVQPGRGDEPTATPTATPSQSASATPTASPSPAPSPSVSDSVSPSATDSGSASTGTSGGSSTGGSGTPTTGGLASTGAHVGAIAGIAMGALLVGGGAVFLVRRRRTAT
ncbi:choice-of-anchor M domain-containing protein [Streptomyces sp. SID12501]|uniref:LPXTG cell wall anchor domain-containing protein n=1 Tax=Streptomyces sp. SID12501 TaxID=2706042 RepID=A0A6B3C7D1_9ACTN|nr:choice-of-anchor M domain-containing protein [Streptomyces sp. SID12501]NEC92334.1 LPXTG cell wall anchor domain-containing protein [Streptomyces sp. SID12501]